MITDLFAAATYLEYKIREFTDLAVVGISGGVDSSVVAAICTRALGPTATHLVSMPYDQIDRDSFNARSAELADQLGAVHHVVAVGESCRAIEAELERIFSPEPLETLTRANVRPRVRMNVLYSICGQVNLKLCRRTRVIGTGHLSEDLIGYDTKGGDALADLFILSDLVKSEVYQLARHYRIPQSIIDAEPSAGLYAGQTDLGELGMSYDELEPATLALFRIIQSGLEPHQITLEHPEFRSVEPRHREFVVRRYQQHFHKHRAPLTVPVRNCEWIK